MPNSPDNITVLVADDEPSTLALVASHVRSKGYKVLEASDGDQAWQLAHEHLPDLVVLDVMMPGMSGWEVCRKIREAVSLAHTGVVMLTGIGENLNEMTSPLYGADTYIDKPFEFTELDAKIRETLEQRQHGAMGRPDAASSPKRASSRPPASDDVASSDRSTPIEDRPTAPSAKHGAEPTAKASAPKKAKAESAPAKKKPAKKAPPKKVTAKKATAKKAAAKTAKKAAAKTAKKAAAKKKTAKKGPPRQKKAAPKKGKAAKKAPPKKARKAPTKKAPSRTAKARPKKAAAKPKAAKPKAKRAAPKPAAAATPEPTPPPTDTDATA